MDDDERSDAPRVFKEFDCPECSANNPIDDGFSDGAEIRCLYCGLEFRVQVREGKLRLREV